MKAANSLKKTREISSGPNYSAVPEELYHCDLGDYHTNGIQVTTSGFTYILHDICVCKSTVDRIVELSNRHGLSEIHLYDFVSDMLD